MHEQTVHALAQLIRHTRGGLTTIEKWVEQTPREALAADVKQLCELFLDDSKGRSGYHRVVYVVRGLLTQLDTTLSTAPQAPVPAPHTTPSTRPAPVAARSFRS